MSTSTLVLAIAIPAILAFVWRSAVGGDANSKIVHDKIKAGALGKIASISAYYYAPAYVGPPVVFGFGGWHRW